MTLNKGRNWAFIGVELQFKICFRSICFLCCFSFHLVKGQLFFLAFWGQKIGYFEGWGQVQIVWGCFDLFGPYWTIFVINVGLKNCFGVHSCSLTTFIFYDYLNSDI